MKRFFFVLLFVNIGVYTYSQTKYIVSGIVADSSGGESLPAAIIKVDDNEKAYATNNYGYYSIELLEGHHKLVYYYMGYQPIEKQLNLTSNVQLSVLMVVNNQQIQEVIVNGTAGMSQSSIGAVRMTAKQVASLPSATGEADVLRSLQHIPGVQTSGEGTSNFNVRGGSFSQNLILIDEAPLYNPSHTLGLFSAINSGAIKSFTVYKGGFPAQYGGRLSSVVELTTKEGDMEHYNIDGNIGVFSSQLSTNGPLVKDKASFWLSGRYGYPSATVNFMGNTAKDLFHPRALNGFSDDNKISFYDINAKLNVIADSSNRLYLSCYRSYDDFYSNIINNDDQLIWGNTTGTLRWNHSSRSGFFSNQTLYYSHYQYQYNIRMSKLGYYWSSDIWEAGWKNDLSSIVFNQNIKVGTFLTYHFFEPGRIEKVNGDSPVVPYSLDTKKSVEGGAYASADIQLTDHLLLTPGLRYNAFVNLGKGCKYSYNADMTEVVDSTVYGNMAIMNVYHSIEPRVSLVYSLGQSQNIKAAYSKIRQPLHLLSNSYIGMPTDVWLPADDYLKMSMSDLYSVGYSVDIKSIGVNTSVELYYKTLDNIVDYRDNADLFMNKYIHQQLLMGKGWSKGIELLIERNYGVVTGWLSYTYAKTQYKVEGVNNNEWYSPRFDIRHNVSLNLACEVNEKWSLSGVFKYTSGGYITMPNGYMVFNEVAFPTYKGRNKYELPAYHRLDLMATYRLKPIAGKWNHKLSFGIYNIYNRKNIFALFPQTSENSGLDNLEIKKMYLFGAMPFLSYSFSF